MKPSSVIQSQSRYQPNQPNSMSKTQQLNPTLYQPNSIHPEQQKNKIKIISQSESNTNHRLTLKPTNPLTLYPDNQLAIPEPQIADSSDIEAKQLWYFKCLHSACVRENHLRKQQRQVYFFHPDAIYEYRKGYESQVKFVKIQYITVPFKQFFSNVFILFYDDKPLTTRQIKLVQFGKSQTTDLNKYKQDPLVRELGLENHQIEKEIVIDKKFDLCELNFQVAQAYSTDAIKIDDETLKAQFLKQTNKIFWFKTDFP